MLGRLFRTAFVLGLLAAVALASTACAQTASGMTQDKPVMLAYQMNPGMDLLYEFVSGYDQTTQVQGQDVPVHAMELIGFAVTPEGMEGSDYLINVTIDTISAIAEASGDTMVADVGGVIGRSFEMTLSKSGVEGNLPEAAALVINIGPQNDRSIVPAFVDMFPNLPEHEVAVGDTWPSEIKVTQPEGGGATNLMLKVHSTLDGYERYNGRDCVKISSRFVGQISGRGQQRGFGWSMQADTNGSSVCYFDFGAGVLVSDAVTGNADGSVTVHGPNGDEVSPLMRTYEMTTTLVE
jgi:hypothetical protein